MARRLSACFRSWRSSRPKRWPEILVCSTAAHNHPQATWTTVADSVRLNRLSTIATRASRDSYQYLACASQRAQPPEFPSAASKRHVCRTHPPLARANSSAPAHKRSSGPQARWGRSLVQLRLAKLAAGMPHRDHNGSGERGLLRCSQPKAPKPRDYEAVDTGCAALVSGGGV